LGTAPIGSTPEWIVYWGPQDEQEAIKTIRTALDVGVDWIDTAPFYGWGRAEKIVRKAIKGRRDQVHVFTKCGTIPDGSLSEGVLADNFDIDKLDPKDFRRPQLYAQPENRDRIEKIRQAFSQVANAHDGTIVNAVIAWELMHPALTGAIIGVGSQNEAREIAGGAGWKLTPHELRTIEDALAAWGGSRHPAS
jgi:aryl-alcohol dehydrogenase-like predicted oxidoreductase